MKIKILVGLLIVLIVLNLATIGSYVYFRWVQPPPPPEFPPPPPHRKFPPSRAMQLRPEQRIKLHRLRKEFMKEARPYRQEIGRLRQDIIGLLLQEEVDTAAIYRKLEEISALQMNIEKQAINLILKTREFLTPWQLSFIYTILDVYADTPGKRRPRMKPPFQRRYPPMTDSIKQDIKQ